jgi:citrate lyase subunit beta/citryl-CoA lyase
MLRSYLFVPGNRPDRFARAIAAGADAVIIDLEDAVPPSDKTTARGNVAAWLSPERPVIVRINAFDTEWFRDDLRVCRHAGVAGVVLPKAERVEQIQAVAEGLEGATPILPIIETAQGVWRAEAIARAPRVRLLFGAIDLSIDLGISGEDEALLYARSHVVLVSRVAGIEAPVDGPTTSIDSVDRVRADAQRAKRLGFGGKLCIHPNQVAPVHESFGPTAEEVAWARRVIEAAAASSGSATSVDGEMVDRPVIVRAESILSRASS